jgi:hypothetical protein
MTASDKALTVNSRGGAQAQVYNRERHSTQVVVWQNEAKSMRAKLSLAERT